MLLGLLLFTACLLLQACTLWSSLAHHDEGFSTLPTHCWRLILPAGAAVLGLLHAAGLFSTSFLLAEGQMVCFLVAAFSLLLLHAALAATLHSPAEVDVQAHLGSCGFGCSPSACNRLLLSETVAIGVHVPSKQDSPDARPGKQGRSASTIGHGRSLYHLYHKSLMQQSRRNRHCSHAAVWGVGLLVVNALMGSMGLVVRTGHDAMHKAAPTQEPAQHMQTVADTLPDLILPDVGNQNSVHAFASTQWLSAALLETQNLLAPLVCVLIFPFVLLDANTMPVSTGRGHHILHTLAVRSLWFCYCVLALYWVTCQAGQADASLSFLFEPILTAYKLHLGKSWTQTLYTAANCIPCMHVLSRSLNQPFRLLMPHMIFLSSAFSITTLLIFEAEDQWQPKNAVKHQTTSNKACTFMTALTAPILLVLGPSKGLVCALALLQCTSVVKLLRYAQKCHSSASSRVGADGTERVVRQSEGWLGVAEGCLWALISTQLFFCSGHFCEFAGLQYAAGQRTLLIMQVNINVLHGDFLAEAFCESCNRFAIIALLQDAKACWC